MDDMEERTSNSATSSALGRWEERQRLENNSEAEADEAGGGDSNERAAAQAVAIGIIDFAVVRL